ncbi:hypothetical protein HOY82DRAFT_542131 [Tuber indicum]|nr:hypothetical protein HOY82DRAFT_542131 [Tuber indicum]
MSTTMEYVVTHTFTKTVIFGMVLKVIGDVMIGYFGESAGGSAGMTVNQYNEVPVTELNNLTSIIAAVCMQQLFQQMQELMIAVIHNVTTETVTATITAPPHATRPAPPTFPFDHHQISWLREFFDSLEYRDKYKPTPAATPVVTSNSQWWPPTRSRHFKQITDGQQETGHSQNVPFLLLNTASLASSVIPVILTSYDLFHPAQNLRQAFIFGQNRYSLSNRGFGLIHLSIRGGKQQASQLGPGYDRVRSGRAGGSAVLARPGYPSGKPG